MGESHTCGITRISSFPTELLTAIFYMCREVEPSRVDRFALVCSRWRSAALSSPLLWSRIDCRLRPSKGLDPGVLARAELHVSRSGYAPLDFYLSAGWEKYNSDCDDKPVENLCKLVGPRMRSLHLDFEEFSASSHRPHFVLGTLLRHCVPVNLTKLVTTDSEYFGFIVTTDDHHTDGSTLIIRSKHAELDEALSSVSVLHLAGFFPRWTSHAYHGLVDLRLYPVDTSTPGTYNYEVQDGYNAIPEAQLVKILKASPRLRVLHLGIEVTNVSWPIEEAPADRVHLAHLEILQISTDSQSFDQIGAALRLLEPGPKPLHLAIRYSHSPDHYRVPSSGAIKDFLARSNVRKLYVNDLVNWFDLLSSIPCLQVLIVAHHKRWPVTNHYTTLNQCDPNDQPVCPTLDVCFMLHCSLPLDKLVALTRHCRPKTLTLFDNTFYHNLPNEKVEIGRIEKELTNICADVRIPTIRPSLVEHRDLFRDR